MGLSLCMIVRDEAENLPRCLASVRGVVDEMIVLDTGSTDRTITIAQDQGARVYSWVWQHDFAAARNESLKYAKGDWILVLDADEELEPGILPALQQVMQQDRVLVANLLRQETGTLQPYSLVSRLFRNRSEIRFARPYHELIDDSVAALRQREPDWQVVELAGIGIHHRGYQATAIAQRQKVDRARQIMEAYLTSQPQDAYICSKLGALYADLNQPDKALQLLQRGLQLPEVEPTVRYELHYHLGSLYSQMQHPAAAETHYQQAVEQPVSDRCKLAAYTNWGSLLQERGELLRARTLFETTITIDPGFAIGYFNLGLTLKTLGDLPAAVASYEKALQLQPDYADAYQNLGVVLLKLGNLTASVAAFRQAIALHRQQGSPEAERLQQALTDMGLL